MAFKQAERTHLYLRCALFGPSGSGKTMTALRMAKGIADKLDGRFAVIDTESRSASKYADRISFDVDDLTEKDIDSVSITANLLPNLSAIPFAILNAVIVFPEPEGPNKAQRK